MKRTLSTLFAVLLLGQATAWSVPLTGSNGRIVNFAGVFEARPAGLIVRIAATSPEVTVAWDKFDLEKMRANQPDIFEAYTTAVETGAPVSIRKGIYTKLKSYPDAMVAVARIFHTPFSAPAPDWLSYLNEFGPDEGGNFGKLLETSNREQKVFADYKTFVDEFFEGKIKVSPGINLRLGVNVDPKSADKTSAEIVEYLANSTHRSRNDALYYFKNNPEVLVTMTRGVDAMLAEIPNALFIDGDRDHERLIHVLKRCAENLKELKKAKTFSSCMEREFEDLKEILAAAEPLFRAAPKVSPEANTTPKRDSSGPQTRRSEEREEPKEGTPDRPARPAPRPNDLMPLFDF